MTKTVNVSVSNVYKNSTYRSDIVSQAILGESVEVIKTENDFDNIKQPDGYEGWIKNNQLATDYPNSKSIKTITSHAIQIYSEMDESSFPVRDAVIGSRLNVIEEANDWYRIQLPDGKEGWIQKKHFGEFQKLSRENVVKLAKQFIGYPYFWGGLSPRGLDCSGLTQTVFKLLGYQLPRDSYMQKDATKEISKNISDAKEGDLLFFGNNKITIDHVGIALGNDGIIHSRGMVKINNLNKSAQNYDTKLKETLIAVTTVF